MDLGLEGRVALVTGSHRGTGAGIAEQLASEGATVLVHGFEEGQPDEVVARIRAGGADAHPVVGDILRDDGARALADRVLREYERVDVLVNNYGVAERGRWQDDTTDEWIEIYHKNVLSGVRMVRAFAPAMREHGWGRIIWLGTIGSVRPNARMPHYYASKGALPTLCVSLAKELAGSGITVNLVSPGLIATAEVVAQVERARAEGREDGWAAALRDSPIGRMAEVREVASLVAFVAGEPAGAINGANLRVDGGAADCAVA